MSECWLCPTCGTEMKWCTGCQTYHCISHNVIAMRWKTLEKEPTATKEVGCITK